MRLDSYLVEKGYFESRNKAQAEIKNGNVLVDGIKILKPSFDVSDSKIEILDKLKYVSRGGLKLEEAIKSFNLDFNDKIILDIGSSTGGFTDCSIKSGAKLVVSVDVGSNQLYESLRNNPKIEVHENTNILDFETNHVFDFIVMDVSFVSIEYLIDGIMKFVNDNNSFITLIKPQFEIGNIHIKNGIVKNRNDYLRILNNIDLCLKNYNLGIDKLILSPILGGDGNKEFLALIKKNIKTKINFLSFLENNI